jgi:hypothetical protein
VGPLYHLHRQSRKKRSRRHRRRPAVAAALLRGFALLLLLAVGVAALRLLSEGIHHYADNWGPHPTSRGHGLSALAGPQALAIRARNRRMVYPYSVIPGGVTSADELRQASAHDATVAAHYAGFDYKRARVVEVDRPRLVYLSYRRGAQIYWTRKQLSLNPGEKLLTDGRITARARCGNQVSVLPQANTSPQEPLIAELDRPDAVASGDVSPSSSFNSDLLQVEPVPAGPPSTGGELTGGGNPVGPGPPGISVPFPIGLPGTGGGGCVPRKGTDGDTDRDRDKDNDKCKPGPPAEVPEPGSLVLVLSGAAAIFARYFARYIARYRRTRPV